MDPDDGILSLSASHAATAVLTKKHRIFVCYDFTVKSLRFADSRHLENAKLSDWFAVLLFFIDIITKKKCYYGLNTVLVVHTHVHVHVHGFAL